MWNPSPKGKSRSTGDSERGKNRIQDLKISLSGKGRDQAWVRSARRFHLRGRAGAEPSSARPLKKRLDALYVHSEKVGRKKVLRKMSVIIFVNQSMKGILIDKLMGAKRYNMCLAV